MMQHKDSSLFFMVAVIVFSFLLQVSAVQAKEKKAPSKPVIGYGMKKLPPLVRKMYQAIYRAARSGDLEMMRTVLETNELLPLIDDKLVENPVDYWMKISVAGDGLSIFAQMTRILEAGYVKRKGKNGAALYIWPFFAELDNHGLEDYQKVQLYRTVPQSEALTILKAGKYTSYSLGIGEDGTWHFFRRNQ